MPNIADDLLDPDKKCLMAMRVQAALRIQRLRSVIHQIAPYQGEVFQNLVSKLLPRGEIEDIYWVELQVIEDEAARARAKPEADAIAWIGC